jgi:hypothetical protein
MLKTHPSPVLDQLFPDISLSRDIRMNSPSVSMRRLRGYSLSWAMVSLFTSSWPFTFAAVAVFSRPDLVEIRIIGIVVSASTECDSGTFSGTRHQQTF